MLQLGLRSKSQPGGNLAKRIEHMSYLGQLGARYNLQDELSVYGRSPDDGPRRNEKVYPNCEYMYLLITHNFNLTLSDPDYICRVPYRESQQVSDDVHRKIALYFSSILGKSRNETALHLPCVVDVWGKIRIRNKGDSIRSTFATKGKLRDSERDSSYIRVCGSTSWFNLLNAQLY